ncbi:MAG: PAS domain-containing protein [Caldilineaceae bacterium]|nr:PAS domain-containing protein [Caldilineaceae bacterium]
MPILPQQLDQLIFALAALLPVGLPLLLIRLNKIYLARNVFLIGGWTLAALVVLTAGGTRAPFFASFIVIVLFAALLSGWRWAVVYVATSVAFGLILAVIDPTGVLMQPFATPMSAWLTHSGILLSGGGITYFMLWRDDRALRRAQNALAEREKLQQTLKDSEERFRLIASVTSDYTFTSIFTPQGQVETALLTGAFEEILGYTYDELVSMGNWWRAILHPDDLAKDDQDMAALNANQAITDEVRIFRKDGDTRWVRVQALPIWNDEKDRLVGVSGGVQDITERKHVEILQHSFLDDMRALQQLHLELSEIDDLQTLYFKMVEITHKRLDLDRIGLFMLEDGGTQVRGTYGVDTYGAIRDEHYYQEEVRPDHWTLEVALKPDHVLFYDNVALYDNAKKVGMGWRASAALWNGQQALGYLVIDNLITHTPARAYTVELLSLLGSTFGHLIERKQRDMALAQYADELERRVEQRTADLATSNRLLQQEVVTRTEAEHALFAQNRMFQKAQEVALMGSWEWDLGTDVVQATQTAFDIVGLEIEDGRNEITIAEFFKQIHPDDLQRVQQITDSARVGQGDHCYYARIIRPDGVERDVYLEWIVDGTNTGAPRSVLTGIIQDVTERKQAELDLIEAKNAAEAASRAKSIFLSNMSHEIRTPLNAILGFAQLMGRDATLDPAQNEKLEVIKHSGQHLLGLINGILELSRIEAGRATFSESHFDLHALLNSLEGMFGLRALEKNLQLRVECRPGVPRFVATDEQKLRQILVNLLSNAIKFTDTGAVTLSVTHQREDAAQLLHFAVEDTGIGIAPEDAETLFQAFAQARRPSPGQEGAGLGLTISSQFARLLGGELTVHSRLDQGASFRFAIPVKIADFAAIETGATERIAVRLSPGQPSYRILVAEDHVASRILLSSLLDQVGFDVQYAANGQEAVDLQRSWQPHLIWMDMRMPILDGRAATQQIRAAAHGQAPIIIALTASAFEEDRAEILANCCDDYVRKPFHEQEIFDKITEHLGVQFIYEDATPAERPRPTAPNVELTAADLAPLPADWIAELHHAAIRAKGKQALHLINQIRAQHSDIADRLARLVQEYRFDKLVTITNVGHTDA